MRRRTIRKAIFASVAALATACTNSPSPDRATRITTTSMATSTTVALAPTTGAGIAPFASAVTEVRAADLPSSWRPGCPVAPGDLRRVQLSFWGFDGRPHTGVLIVHVSVAGAVTSVFAKLYEQRFPIRSIEPIDKYGGSDEASLDADNTAGFNCRRAVTSGPPHWSAHAYGKAIDVNPVENPYLEGGNVHPAAGAAYVTRSPDRPGMAVRGGALVAAFAGAGWQWGGRWTGSPDYQHFSSNGG